MKFNTKCVHKGTQRDDRVYGVNTPVHRSTAYLYPNEQNVVKYPRYSDTPTQIAAAKKIAALEGGEEGLVFSSGMGAISTTLFTFLGTGDHAVFQSGLYGGTQRFIANQVVKMGIETSFVDSSAVNDFISPVKENTKVIYFESPTNPLMKVLDLKALAEGAREKGILTIIDNTFATPVNQRPLEHGIDIVVHSGTKYLNGHSDLLCGAVVTSKELMEKIHITEVDMGPSLDMAAAFMLERGLKTLGLRVARQNENAIAIANFLEAHEKVKAVHYPGLESHHGHSVARAQMDGFGGMMSFELDCSLEGLDTFCKALKVVTVAVSLGGVETLLTIPAQTSHSYLTPEERQAQGITDSLIRFSVGIEDKDDLIEDIEQALLII